MKTIVMSDIYTNAVDLARKIERLRTDDDVVNWGIEIVKGIDGEDVVKIKYIIKLDEED